MTDDKPDNHWEAYVVHVKKIKKSNYEIIIPETNIQINRSNGLGNTQKTPPIKGFFKIDLHNLTVTDAFSKLEYTFANCAKHNILNLLVITGKGYKIIGAQQEQKGTLRSEFERWMYESTLANVVSEFSIARNKDGGDGAFYVRLKKVLKS